MANPERIISADAQADAEEDARALAGEGAVELEAAYPAGPDKADKADDGTAGTKIVLDPATEEEIEALRRSTEGLLNYPHVSIYHLAAGPDGQMISGDKRN